ncbi:hypothetical protein EMCG_01832 [[Emmonsia] crescens]|uniref:DUF7770 domain-containing protein n=1 Tax=[Emmonsia] crescens TaxID=73230 RepID=A0A0G2J284_9EURO|nr:hypothetical protein EMCG_01832 [Emmonsia crescens UAMH 3008]
MSQPISTDDLINPMRVIRVTIHTMGFPFENSTRSDNHASIFLVVNSQSSVRMTMMNNYSEMTCEYDVSLSSVKDVDLKPTTNATVGEFFDLIHQKKLDQYELHADEWAAAFGCKKSALQAFQTAGLIDPSASVSQAYEALEYNYSRNQPPQLSPMIAGKFLSNP